MPYAAANDPWKNFPKDAASFGKKGRMLVPSNNDITPYPKSVMVCAAGDVVYLPAENQDGSNNRITITEAPVGLVLPHVVRRVISGTCCTIDD